MSLSDTIIYALGDFLEWSTAILFDNVGNTLNYLFILIMLFGAIYWLRTQAKLIKRDHIDPR